MTFAITDSDRRHKLYFRVMFVQSFKKRLFDIRNILSCGGYAYKISINKTYNSMQTIP